MKRKQNRYACLLLAAVLLVCMLSACAGNGASDTGTSFTWWINQNDGYGTLYNAYEDNVAVQWMNAQYWDTENHTLGTEGNGTKLSLSFQVPVSGAESDNFNTMISTGEYPEVIDLSYADSPKQLYDDGHLIEITEYVEKYLPNYLEVLERFPEVKKFTVYTDENGDDHYYALYTIYDGLTTPWEGYMYRRDWVVKYAEPTAYVWDWDSDSVKTNGHPDVTPLSKALEAGNLNGWKENEVTVFESSEGSDPINDYTDNVIFPSGLTDPYTISDWEWMFEAFAKAIEDEGFSGNTNAYCTTLTYLGYMQTGDLVSSFGGGGPTWYIDENGDAAFGGTGENFRTYLECMNTWNNNGWLDTKFETRSSDMFYMINSNGYSQGMVGMWCGGAGVLGTTIRATCATEAGKKEAMVFGASLPVNDMYGTGDQMYKEPDMLYQLSRVGPCVGFTTKCEGKDMEALFSMINYLYSFEGSLVCSCGLSKAQYESMVFEPDLYAKLGLTDGAYTITEQTDGTKLVSVAIPYGQDAANAVKCQRFGCYVDMKGSAGWNYDIDFGYSSVVGRAMEQWTKYESTAYIMTHDSLMTAAESAVYSKTNTYVRDYMGQAVPNMIKNGLASWDEYCTKLNKYAPDKVTEIYQQYVK